MTEATGPTTEANDPDPYDEAAQRTHTTLGGSDAAVEGEDPTGGGKTGEIGEAPSVASDEPSDGGTYGVGGGHVTEEEDAVPVSGPGSADEDGAAPGGSAGSAR